MLTRQLTAQACCKPQSCMISTIAGQHHIMPCSCNVAARKEAVEAEEKREREAREARDKAQKAEQERVQKEAASTEQLEASKLSKVEPTDSDSVTSTATPEQQEGAGNGQQLAEEIAAAGQAMTGQAPPVISTTSAAILCQWPAPYASQSGRHPALHQRAMAMSLSLLESLGQRDAVRPDAARPRLAETCEHVMMQRLLISSSRSRPLSPRRRWIPMKRPSSAWHNGCTHLTSPRWRCVFTSLNAAPFIAPFSIGICTTTKLSRCSLFLSIKPDHRRCSAASSHFQASECASQSA